MIEDKEKKEQLKEIIFSIFLECCTESDQRQKNIGQLWDFIIKYGNKYLKMKTDEMGVEIFEIIQRIIKNVNAGKLIKEKNEFFRILNRSLKRGEFQYNNDNDESEKIHIPKDKKFRFRKAEKEIEIMKERFLGRGLTAEERSQCILKWFKKEAEYIEVKDAINVGSLYFNNENEDGEVDVLNYVTTVSDDPVDEYIKKTDMDMVRETVKSLLEKKQPRSRDCYKALFTLYCIENYKDFVRLYPVLDNKILEEWHKTDKKYKQYEIYQKYHPNAQKSSADAMASKNLTEFLYDIKAYLKEKNH